MRIRYLNKYLKKHCGTELRVAGHTAKYLLKCCDDLELNAAIDELNRLRQTIPVQALRQSGLAAQG
ncbi:hypothetical protein [Silvimonas sp.]|uniref:hypothetical protein n=1 Tax=Silvimonas sp. TaxID=2650811 RepID=UPI002844916B|nr:hypothetical protein [Silvimonas sp.]MDR3428997.1 hypothetical protein [Silvimonas sp.]